MKSNDSKFRAWARLSILLVFSLLLASACSTFSDNVENTNGSEHQDDNHEHGDGETHEQERTPNNGAIISIISPADGDTFKADAEIVIRIEVENFELSVNEGHWHVYINGESLGMVLEGRTEITLPDLEPGEHEISVYLTEFTHVELEDGATIHIHIDSSN